MKMTNSEYRQESNAYNGYCYECDDITTDGVEPDAEDYTCPECDSMSVMGVEQALLCGYIHITD